MKVVIQRVSHASVTIEGEVTSSIGLGLLILLGISQYIYNADDKGCVGAAPPCLRVGDNTL